MTNPDITIEDVHVQLDESGRYLEGKVQVTVTLKNNSKTATYYVLKRSLGIFTSTLGKKNNASGWFKRNC